MSLVALLAAVRRQRARTPTLVEAEGKIPMDLPCTVEYAYSSQKGDDLVILPRVSIAGLSSW